MQFLCFCRKRRQSSGDKATTTTSWNDLLTCQGLDLWNIRLQTVLLGTRVKLPIHREKNPKNTYVCVLSSISDFETLEQHHGMDKFPNHKNDSSAVFPLTQCTGDEWIRQRQTVKQAFFEIPQRSLEAVEPVNFDRILPDKSKKKIIDLKQVCVNASLRWVVRLFLGQDDLKLENAFHCFWKHNRAKNKCQKSIIKARQALIASMVVWDGGVLQSLANEFASSSRRPDDDDAVAKANAVNAMIAAHDAAQSLLFWTLWNIARTNGAWNSCRNEQDNTNLTQDLETIASLKQQATQGRTDIVYGTSLSYLGRALMETVRVYPPVWTLPRTWPLEEEEEDACVVAAKLDVPTTNQVVLDRDSSWNPDDTTTERTIASFGVGKRHCPAGTAALYAVYTFLQKFIRTYGIQECDTDHALRSVYLGPTLCVEGPQLFHICAYEQQ